MVWQIANVMHADLRCSFCVLGQPELPLIVGAPGEQEAVHGQGRAVAVPCCQAGDGECPEALHMGRRPPVHKVPKP